MGSVVLVLGGVLRRTLLATEKTLKGEHLFVEEKGAWLVLTSGSCHINGPLITLGKTNIKRASFHKLEMRTREATVY